MKQAFDYCPGCGNRAKTARVLVEHGMRLYFIVTHRGERVGTPTRILGNECAVSFELGLTIKPLV